MNKETKLEIIKGPITIIDEISNEKPRKKKSSGNSNSEIRMKRDNIQFNEKRVESDDENNLNYNFKEVNINESLNFLTKEKEEKIDDEKENDLNNKINNAMISLENYALKFIKIICETEYQSLDNLKREILIDKMKEKKEIMNENFSYKNESKKKEIYLFEKYIKMCEESNINNYNIINVIKKKTERLKLLSEKQKEEKDQLKKQLEKKKEIYNGLKNNLEEIEINEKKIDLNLNDYFKEIEKCKKEIEDSNKESENMKNEIILLRPFFKRLLILKKGNDENFKIEISRNRENIIFQEKDYKFDMIISVINNLIEFPCDLKNETNFIFKKFYNLFQSLIIKFSTSDRNFLLIWLSNDFSFETLNHLIIQLIIKVNQIISDLYFTVKAILKDLICAFPYDIDDNLCKERIKNINSEIFGFVYCLNKEFKGKNISFNIFNITYNYENLKSILLFMEGKYQKKKKIVNVGKKNNKEKEKEKEKNSNKLKDILVKEFLNLKPAQTIIINDIFETDLNNEKVKEIIETISKKI